MAKSQKRSNREERKPKAAKAAKAPVALAPNDNAQFKNAVRDPKAKH
ncbi:hypothetical protein [Novosphingobium sp. FSW06-99]|nr:hypothetical protein [Novosphingobium sp. FSW06-99]